MKYFSIFFFVPTIMACQFSPENKDQKPIHSDSTYFKELFLDLSTEQQSAFDAFNEIQVNTDENNRLYSTFANIRQPCYPADSSFEILQSDFLIVMQIFLNQQCKNLNPKIRNQLARSSVLAQEKYLVLHCKFGEDGEASHEAFPIYGKWIMPNILGIRDLIIVW